MRNISVNNGLVDKYQPSPNKYYDIQGKVLKNDGKDIKVEKNTGSKVIEYDIKLKDEIDAKVGETIEVAKENIRSVKFTGKDKLSDEDSEEIGKIIENLNMEHSEEHMEIIENLIDMGVKPTKENIESYKQSKNSLTKVVGEINTDSLVKLMDKGIDFEDLNLMDLSEALDMVKAEDEEFSIKEFLKLDKELDYKDAEKISKEIYGQKMGKDVYDIIIALDKENIEINKGNIDEALNVLGKVHDLKGLDDKDYIVLLKEEMDFSINNLFRIKNEYTVNRLDSNDGAGIFEDSTIIGEVSFENLKELLESLDIESTDENIAVGREFLLNDMSIVEEDFYRVLEMKSTINELKEKMTDERIVKLLDRNVDILEEDVVELLEVMDMEVEDGLLEDMNMGLEELEFLTSIEDRDLLNLIKSGKDFNLSNLKEIVETDLKNDLSLDFKVLDRSKLVVDMLDIIGDSPKIDAVTLAIEKKAEEVSLNDLYENTIEIDENNPTLETVEKEIENMVVNEYIRARNNISTSFIRESIRDGKDMINMPLNRLNKYMDKKVNRYREISELTSNIKNIELNQDRIIPIIMKNDLSMTLKEINDLNSYLLGNKGLSQAIKEASHRGEESKSRYKDEIAGLQKEVSRSIKDDTHSVKEDYKDLINLLSDHNKDMDEDGDSRKDQTDEYIKLQEKISKKDTIFQLPIEIGGDYKDLNIIIPNTDKGVDKNNMKFALSLNSENLGYMDMDLQVIGKEIFINLGENDDKLIGSIGLLEDSLEEIGYSLNMMENI